MEIFLIRHGECENRASYNYNDEIKMFDPSLTKLGREQAERFAELLKDVQFDAIYSSDLLRSIVTADILAEKCSSKRIIAKEFREIDMGELENKTWKDFPDIYEKWRTHTEDIPFPNGECGADVWARIEPQLVGLARRGYRKVAIVTHGGVIMSTVCGVLGMPQQMRFVLGHPITNCSITRLLYEKERFYLVSMNENVLSFYNT